MRIALRSVVYSGLVAAGLTVAGGALAFTPAPLPASPSLIEDTAGGCGPGWHRNAWGACVRNYYGGYGVYGYGYRPGWHGGYWGHGPYYGHRGYYGGRYYGHGGHYYGHGYHGGHWR